MSEVIEGTIADISEVPAGTELAVAAVATDTTLEVVDLDGLDWDGGQLQIGEEIHTYTIDPESEVIVDLATPLADSYDAEEPVMVYPTQIEKWAAVVAPDQGEDLEVRVTHSLYDRLPEGTRDPDAGEVVLVTLDDDEYVVSDVLFQEPIIDGSFLDPDTVPPASTDGLPPASSPTPTLFEGPGFLTLTWDPVSNADPVFYEVHVAGTAAFTPDSSTLAALTPGTGFVITELGGVPLEVGTTYYAKVVAYDADGAASPGGEVSGSPILIELPNIEPIDFTDLLGTIDADTQISAGTILAGKLVANTLTANEIAANAITSSELAANAVVAGKIAAGTIVANDIAAGTITAAQIAAGTITATQLAATAIDAMTITGATYRTSASAPQILIQSSGILSHAGGFVFDWSITPTGGFDIAAVVGSATPTDARSVSWSIAGDQIARLYAYEQSDARVLVLNAEGYTTPAGADSAQAYLGANVDSDGLQGNARLHVFSDLADSEVDASVYDGVNPFGLSILKHPQLSDFLQIADAGEGAPERIQVQFGASVIAAGANPGASLAINHGLPGTPDYVIATSSNSIGAGSVFINVTVGTIGATQFTASVRHVTGANIGGNVTVYWAAIYRA